MCSNNITTTRTNTVFEVQLPRYQGDVANGTVKLNASETIYSLWIGTNDLGYLGLLTGRTNNGATVVNTTLCATKWVQSLYDSGARYFLFQTVSINQIFEF